MEYIGIGIVALIAFNQLIVYTNGKSQKPEKSKKQVIIYYKIYDSGRAMNINKTLCIATDKPQKLSQEILEYGPIKYIKEKSGYAKPIFESIDTIGNDSDIDDDLLCKIAKFMELDITNIEKKEDLAKLIDDHITYNPYSSLNEGCNEGYKMAEVEFKKKQGNL